MLRHRQLLCLLAAMLAVLGQGALVAAAGWHYHAPHAPATEHSHDHGDHQQHDDQGQPTGDEDCSVCHLMHAPVAPGLAATEPCLEFSARASRLGEPAPAHLRWVRATCARGPPLPA